MIELRQAPKGPVTRRHERPRKYLTEAEMEAVVQAGRRAVRDQALILVSYRRGLCSAEAAQVTWRHVDLANASIDVPRLEGSVGSVRPLSARAMRLLRRLRRENRRSLFETERGTPLSTRNVRHLVDKYAKAAGIEHAVGAHALCHGCGYKLANEGTDTRTLQAYLGHKNIRHTQGYTELAGGRFEAVYPWSD